MGLIHEIQQLRVCIVPHTMNHPKSKSFRIHLFVDMFSDWLRGIHQPYRNDPAKMIAYARVGLSILCHW